jgi:hypothetical protein
MILSHADQQRIAARKASRRAVTVLTDAEVCVKMANAGFAPIAIGRSFGRSEAWALDKLREDYGNT